MSFTGSVLSISGDFGVYDEAKVTESFIKHFLVNLRVKITNKKIGANILCSLILGGFIDLDGLTEHFNHVHDFDRIISIILTFELHKAITLMFIGDFISGQVNVDHRPTLHKQLPQQTLSDFLIEITHINCCLLISLV